MLNIYVHKKIDSISHIPLLDYYWGSSNLGVKRSGDKAIELFNKQFFNLVENPKEAHYFMIPHNYFYIKTPGYLDDFIKLSKEYNKKIIVFSYGDSDADINIPNSIIFRTSQYAYKKKENEIIMPAIADDLLGEGRVAIKNKSSKPTVGFCGWASFDSVWGFIKQYVKSLPAFLMRSPKRKGILFRIKAIKVLKKSGLLYTNFIIRDTYSGNEKTRIGDFDELRKEYIKNILESDFSLAVKGDGNFSIRFYEILSLGRVPLFVNTDCVLPLEDVINYDDFILKVDYKNIKHTAQIVSDFYGNLPENEFVSMQIKAREVFENYLRIDKYFEYVFSDADPLKLNR